MVHQNLVHEVARSIKPLPILMKGFQQCIISYYAYAPLFYTEFTIMLYR